MRRYRDIPAAALFSYVEAKLARRANVPRFNYGLTDDDAGKCGDALTAELAGSHPPPIARNNAT